MSTVTRTEPLTTSVTLEALAGPTAPARVSTTEGLLAVRTIRRDRMTAEVAMVATGAVLLGGDHVLVRITVADGCTLTVTDVGGTVAYDVDGVPSRWDVVIALGNDSRLDWYGLPCVVDDGADVTRTTTASLGTGARLRLRETIAWGRTGEQGGHLTLRSDVHDARGPVLVEEVRASGYERVPGVLGSARVLDTVLALGDVPDPAEIGAAQCERERVLSALGHTAGADVTALQLARGGLMVRWLGAAAHLSPLERALSRR